MAIGDGIGGGLGGLARLPVNLPSTIPIEVLLNVLGSTDGASAITEDRIRAPDEALLLHIYNILLTIPSLRDAIGLHETQQSENERRKVDMESQLHEAERLKSEAESRAEEDRIAKEQAIKEKVEINGQLAQVQGTLAALQSTSDTGIQQSAEVKGRLEQAEQEKRDVLEMLEREKIESARRSEEIESLALRNRESRTEINRLSSELQESKSAEGSGKFKIQSLEQELALKTNDAKWAHQELTKSTEELTQHRVRSNGEISSLTLQLQQKTQALEASEVKINSLQSAYDNTLTRLDEVTREKSELRQRLVEQEGAFKSEMGTQQRLSALMEQQKDNAERRLADIEEQWEQVLAEHGDREKVLRQDLANQQAERDEIIREKEEIQQALDRLAESVGISTNGYQIGATNGDETASVVSASTPRRPAFQLPDSSAVMSPTAALAAKVQKSGKSFTQIYADLARSEEELRREKSENRRLVGVLEQVMTDLHDRAPALQAQREEKEQLEQHAEELSTALANACQERDFSEHEAKQQRLRADATQQENVLLNQQVTDLARQVRDLTREILIRDDPASAERLEADGTQLGDSTSATTSTISDTQAVITEQLVTFRSLNELITQNSRLLRVVRQLGTEMEARESKYRSDFETQESDAIDEAKAVITRLQEDLRAERTRSEGVRRERDMFRAMTAQGGGVGRSVSGSIQAGSANAENSNAAHVTLTNQYSQLQAQFEAFRSETANDTERLKEEAFQARSEANKNALAAAKEKASRESVEERLANAQQTYNLERRELQDLQKRHNAVQESLAKQEINVQTFSQQLIAAQGSVDRLRNEVANLTAEKQLHKETTDRLMEEKKASVQERINLSDLLRSAQSMQADLERSSGEVRRRLETQIEKLEEQTRDLRDRATKEEEAHRQTSLRREVETTELRAKLDRAVEELAKVREEVAVAKNSVQHLTSRTEDLQKQVESKDEKLAVYERRSSGANAGVNSTASSDLPKEQQLQVEIADLKGELRSAQVEAEQARAHTEQFKSIAAANEEALSQLQASYDQYKARTDAAITQKDSDLTNLRERNEALASELTSSQNEATTERQEREKQVEAIRAEKKTLEDALSEVTAVEDRAKITREGMQEEVQRQVRLTQEAHAKYEAELLAHAEDVKALASVKEQLDLVRTAMLEAQKAKETAEGNLAGSTDSWTRQKELLEREKDELKKVIQEVRGQNEALHKHLESLQAQAKNIRQASGVPGSSVSGEQAANVGDASITSQSDNDELHEVIRYLRREKEIVDLQVELRDQECARLRQSVEHTQRSLDEARMQLSQEREQNAGASASAKQHEELMEKINQLSILRESNATLRDESERAQRKVQGLEAKVESLTKELDPIREEARVKTVELEACQNQLRLSQEDNKRWQGRTQSILQQYNRIDPDELKKLQEQKDAAEKALEEQKVELEERVKELAAAKEEVEAVKGKFDRLRQQSIERIKGLNEKISELKTQNDEFTAKEAQAGNGEEQAALIASLQTELESIKAEKEELSTQFASLQSEKEALAKQIEENVSTAPAQTVSGEGQAEGSNPSNEEAQKAWDAERTQMEEKYKALEQREQRHLQRAKEFLTQLKAAQKERDELQKQTEGVKQEDGNSGSSEEMETLRSRIVQLEGELQQANQRIAELQANGATISEGSADIEQLKREHEQALREQEGNLSTQYAEQQKRAIEIAVQKARSSAVAGDNVEEKVQERLKTFEDQRQVELQSAIQSKEQEIRAHYDEQLKARYEAGKEEATLRNKLLIKAKDSKIEKLTAELNTLKGIAPPTQVGTAAVNGGAIGVSAAPEAATAGVPVRPAAASIRGGAAPRPVARPVPGGMAARGGGVALRGTGRGGAQAVGAQKRKLEGGETGGSAQASNADGGGADANKKPRPAGGPIAIRGGAGGQRGGAANRGGRGGAPQ